MDKILIFCVLLATLSGRFVGTYAESTQNITTTPASNMTTTEGIKATNPTNMSTTPASNVTATAETALASLSNISTTPASNVTATAETIVTSLSNISTTPASNVTATAETTMTMVSTAVSTQFPTVSPNTTVVTLETNITNAECGSQQLCVAEPSKCDPSATGSCFFLAAKKESGQNFNFDLSGESDGYIAATLTGGAGEGDPTYVCANSKGKVKFFGSTLKNGVLTISTLNVNSVKGKVQGKTIQCSFLATVPQPTTRATNLGVSVSTGEFNDTNESLGAPTQVVRVSNVDLANPNNTVTNEITNTTTPASNVTATAEATVTSLGNISTTPASNVTATAEATVTSLGNISTTPASNVTATAETIVTSVSTAVSTQVPAVSPNTTVVTLETNITNAECGSQQLCVAEPSKCDPSTTGSCFFLAAKKESGQNFNFDLSGESDGYIAATLTGGAGEGDPTYVCANNKGKVKFFGSTLKNGVLTISTLNVNSVKGKVRGKTIQCSFLATVPQPTTRATNLGVSVSTGEFNDTNDSLGAPTPVIRVSNVDLANPNNTVTNEITNTTTPAPTGSNATTVSPEVGVLTSQLSTTITRKECGSSKLCAAEPTGCDPAAGDSCYFISVKQQSGQTYNFELSGQSEGYVAAGLSTTETQSGTHTAYICANDNSAVRFFTGTIENSALLKQSQNSSNQLGKVDGRKIQCTFSAELPDTTVRAASYALSVSTGSYDAKTFQLGNPLFQLLTRRANLSDPTANLTNLLNNYAPSLLTPTRSFLPALLVTVCMLAFTAM